MDNYAITLDVEWTPDFIIKQVADILIENHTKATWFMTHDCEGTKYLLDHPDLFEVGLHPNFLEGSTHGSNTKEVMNGLQKIVPDAVSVRTHALVQSTLLLSQFCGEFGLQNDVSLFIPRASGLEPHRLFFEEGLYLTRLPYFWSDYFNYLQPTPSSSLEDEFHHTPGLKIYNFHPIHIALNTCDLANYRKLKSNVLLSQCTPSDIAKFRNNKTGCGDFFLELIKYISKGNMIKEISEKWSRER